MKIIPFHFLTKPQNSGYRDCEALLRSHPKIEVVSKLDDADFVFYWSWGDDGKILNDIESELEKPWLADITGDGCWIPSFEKGLFFTTHPNGHTNNFQIPYSYRRFAAGNNLPNIDTKRDLLASFQGSFATNPKRRELLKFQSPDIFIKEQDGWNLPQDDIARVIKEHDELLLRSKFTFCPVGHGLSSIRVTDAIFHGSIPILIEDFSRPFGQIHHGIKCGYSRLPECIEYLRKIGEIAYLDQLSHINEFKNEFLLRDAHKGIVNELGYLDWIYEKALNYETH